MTRVFLFDKLFCVKNKFNKNDISGKEGSPSDFSQMEMDLSVLTEEEKAKLDEAQQAVAKRSGRKKKFWNILMLIINICVVAGIFLFQILDNKFVPLTSLNINFGWVFVCVLIFCVALFFDTISISYLVKKSCKRSRFALGFKTNICGRYYDAITPLATGGQPFQVSYLMGREVSSTAALSIPIAKLFFQQLTWFVASSVCLIISFTDSSYNSFVNIASIIGFILSFAVLFLTLFLSVSKNVGKKLVAKTLRLLQKMKIVKNYEKQYQKVTAYVEDYQSIMREYVKSKKDFFVMFMTMALRTLLIYSLPFFIYCVFNGYDPSFYGKFFVMGVLVDLASSFIPLPGGTGMNEVSFSMMFAPYFADGPLFWALLLWRFFTYYIYLIMGISMVTYDVAYGNRKYRWLKVERKLREESKEFKDQQIASFRKVRAYRRKRQLKKSEQNIN